MSQVAWRAALRMLPHGSCVARFAQWGGLT